MAQRQPPTLKPLDPETPKVRYQWEPFSLMYREAVPLTHQNWDELDGRDNFSLDVNLYFRLEGMGMLRVLTARRDSKLVGYTSLLVTPDEQRCTKTIATTTAIWLHPTERKGLTGYRLMKRCMQDLQEDPTISSHNIGEKIKFSNKNGLNIGVLLKRLGYNPQEVRYRKELR